MSLLSIVASSSAFRLPASPPPKGSSIDSDWSTKNKKQPGFLRLISAWYAMVFLHLFLASRELRLSHARGHRLESCRDHPQNAATPVPFATFAGTNGTRHAHCLIAPTGRTRCDPDHRVTDLRRGVAESPSAESENRRAQALGGSSPPPSAAPCSLRSTLRLPHRLPPNSLLTRRKIPYHIPLVSLPVFVFCRLGW